MDAWLPVIVAAAASVVASSGFWAFMLRKSEVKSSTTRLLMGLAYVELTTLGMKYIERGGITRDEYEDFCNYFYQPYKALGGNGVAERIMNEVSNLPLQPYNPYSEVLQIRNRDGEILNHGRVVTQRSEETTSGR